MVEKVQTLYSKLMLLLFGKMTDGEVPLCEDPHDLISLTIAIVISAARLEAAATFISKLPRPSRLPVSVIVRMQMNGRLLA